MAEIFQGARLLRVPERAAAGGARGAQDRLVHAGRLGARHRDRRDCEPRPRRAVWARPPSIRRILRREAILDAIRARHTYGTTAARILLEVRVNGRLMGEKIPASGRQAGGSEDPRALPLATSTASRSAATASSSTRSSPAGRNADLTFLDTDPIAGYSYYYVRVMQKDEEIAWSSPVFLGAK